MKTIHFLPAVLLAVAVAGSSALAQDNTGAAPANVQVAPPTPVNGVVYVVKLPTATQLTKDAEEEGLSILRMDQTADRMVVVYKYQNGSTRTFAYTTSVDGSPATAPVVAQVSAPAPAPSYSVATAPTYTVLSAPIQQQASVVYTAPAPTVIYTQPAPAYYYGSYYSPYDFWAPLAIGVGLGWGFSGHYHYYGHGHYYGGGGWHHH